MRTLVSMLLAGSLVTACGAPGSGSTSEPPPTTQAPGATEATGHPETAETTTTTGGTSMAITDPSPGEPLDRLVEEAVADLATRLQVAPATIEVLRTEEITWPDGSLGCPQPGEAYTQALVEGYRVILRHGARIYLYHAGGEGPIFLCPSEDKDGGHEFVPPPGFDE